MVTNPVRRGEPGLIACPAGARSLPDSHDKHTAPQGGPGGGPRSAHCGTSLAWACVRFPGSLSLFLPPSPGIAWGCAPLSRGLAGSAGSEFRHPRHPRHPWLCDLGTPLHSSELRAPRVQRPGLLYVPILRCWGPVFYAFCFF